MAIETMASVASGDNRTPADCDATERISRIWLSLIVVSLTA